MPDDSDKVGDDGLLVETGADGEAESYEEATPMSDMSIADGEIPPWLLEDDGSEQIDAGDYTPEYNAPDPYIANSIPASEEAAGSQNASQKETAEVELEGTDLYDFLTDLCIFPHIKSTHFSDGCDRKIDCFFIDKACMNSKGCVHYLYGKEVKSINITQSMNIYGYQASVEILDINGSLTTIAEYQNNFYFVIGVITIVDRDKEKNENGIMIQPYVFEIEDIIAKSGDGIQTKIYELKMVDIITATLGKVCFGNLLLEYPGFVNSKSFGELYTTLFDYAAKIIYYSFNKKFHIRSRVEFIDDLDEDNTDFIRAVFTHKFDLEDTCRYVLDKLYKKAARQVTMPDDFNGEIPGNVYIPLFVQDETEDMQGRYRAFFNKKVKKKITGSTNFLAEDETYSINATVIKRRLYGKTLLMPFELAFNDQEQSFIYENINPPCDINGALKISENYFNPMNGIKFTPMENVVDLVPSGREVGLGWKNLALISNTPDGGSNNILVFFNWIYEYYKHAFLNSQKILRIDNQENYMMPIQDPHFHVMERIRNEKRRYLDNDESESSKEQLKELDSDSETFAKMNAKTYILQTNDSRNEALYLVGRMIKSFIFLNSMFGFTIKGDVFRHPGEIIKINSSIKSSSMQSATSTIGGLSSYNGYVLAYMTSITHSFNGNEFKDTIYANKICAITRKNEEK